MESSFRGVIVHGPMRGDALIKKFEHRLAGILGFQPFHGTLDIKLEKKIEIEKFSSKYVKHKLLNGREHVELYLAKITLVINKSIRYECWAMQQKKAISKDTIEIINHEKLMDKFDLKEGDEVEVIFNECKPKKKKPIKHFLNRLYGREAHLTRG